LALGRIVQERARAPGRGAWGGGVCSGGVGPPRPAPRPQGGESGERVTRHERTPPPDDGPRPSRARRVREQSGLERGLFGEPHSVELVVEEVARGGGPG